MIRNHGNGWRQQGTSFTFCPTMASPSPRKCFHTILLMLSQGILRSSATPGFVSYPGDSEYPRSLSGNAIPDRYRLEPSRAPVDISDALYGPVFAAAAERSRVPGPVDRELSSRADMGTGPYDTGPQVYGYNQPQVYGYNQAELIPRSGYGASERAIGPFIPNDGGSGGYGYGYGYGDGVGLGFNTGAANGNRVPLRALYGGGGGGPNPYKDQIGRMMGGFGKFARPYFYPWFPFLNPYIGLDYVGKNDRYRGNYAVYNGDYDGYIPPTTTLAPTTTTYDYNATYNYNYMRSDGMDTPFVPGGVYGGPLYG